MAALLCGAAAEGLAPIPPPGVELVHIAARPMLAMTLIGTEVRDATGERAGTVKDLVLNVERNLLRRARLLHPIPLDAIAQHADRLMLRVDPDRLDGRHSFSAEALVENLESNDFLRGHSAYADRLTVGR